MKKADSLLNQNATGEKMNKFGNESVKSCIPFDSIFIAGQPSIIGILTVFFIFSSQLSIGGQGVNMATYHCRQADTPIAIDGKLEEPAWQKATPIEFKLTVDSGRPKFPTTARMLWDDKYLYVGYHCVDEDVWATMTKRDDKLWEEEVVEIFIDANGDSASYIEIEVNPLNALVDLFVLNREGRTAKFLFDWDSKGIRHAVYVDGDVNRRDVKDNFWSVEIALPWEDFVTPSHAPPELGDVWRVNLYRIDHFKGEQELSAWSPTGVPNFHVPQRFGELVFSK